MMKMSKKPPFANGEMELTDEQTTEIREKLIIIREGFKPTDDQEQVDTFYVTATYNKENPDTPVNGDTVEMLLSEGEQTLC